jgi:DNA-binding FadR family transcriptional regulator
MRQGNNLTQSIVEELGIAIVTQKYSLGAPFPVEAELCESFDASRTVLREAVKMLTAKGLLSARPRQGTRVEPENNWNLMDPDVLRWTLERKFSLDLLAEFTEIRLAIEPLASQLAAEKGDQVSLANIERALHRMEQAELGHYDPLEADIAFHISILYASGNRFYAQFADLVETALRISIRFTNQYKGVQVADVDDHRKVFTAIKNQRPTIAHKCMNRLITEALDLIQDAMVNEQLESKQISTSS